MRRATVLGALAIAAALPAWPQRAPTALEVFVQRDKGYCIACHQLPAGVGPASTSDLGPKLEGTRMRTLGKAGIRAAIVDPTAANPDTVMPPFGRHRILDAKQVDQLVEFLDALP
jgi:L-cysteine S-thiosulfotransferase